MLFTHADEVSKQIMRSNADIIICPYLKQRIPELLWRDPDRPVIIIHPGIRGDRGCSSLDWAISMNLPRWGVTALQAEEEMDAGPVWSTSEFDLPENIRKSELYNGAVSEAALTCIYDVIDKFLVGYQPVGINYADRAVKGRFMPTMKQCDRSFQWTDHAKDIKRCIDAADGQPGVLAEIEGIEYFLYDAHLSTRSGSAGKILAVKGSAVLIGTGCQSLWLGYMREKEGLPFKLPAKSVLPSSLLNVEHLTSALSDAGMEDCGYHPLRYSEYGRVGELTFEFYNGALSTENCNDLKNALCWAKAQDTDVLVLRGGRGSFCNGINLNVILAASSPEKEAWENIKAIDDVCYEILTAKQYVVIAITGNAGAGGVMLALTADVVFAREGTVLNPHYQTMGLYGSEYWTYSLPKRIGREQAIRLTQACMPVSCREAYTSGLINAVGPADPNMFIHWTRNQARSIAKKERDIWSPKIPSDMKELQQCRDSELVQMHADMLHNRNGFHEKCRRFVLKYPACITPARLVADWADCENTIANSSEIG